MSAQARFAPGDWYAVVGDHVTVLLPAGHAVALTISSPEPVETAALGAPRTISRVVSSP